LNAENLVWYRMWMAALALILYNLIVSQKMLIIKGSWKKISLASLFVALHWILFFASIKASKISIGVVCMSTQAFMISILQPLLKRTRIKPYEIILGLFVIVSMVMIFGFEYQYKTGIWLGLASSFFAVLFTILNAQLTKELPATVISGWEMGIGALFVSIYLLCANQMNAEALTLRNDDLFYLLILSIVCTALAFAVSVNIMRKLSAYTVSLSVNLEPVYTILLALIIYGMREQLSVGFYAGAGILLLTVLAEPLFSKQK
ncbi:MAG TPA: DMT family transporter, partial [Flavobacteriales bacterium]|nr:DMT family transporter [Flavobacteriales bacterium]